MDKLFALLVLVFFNLIFVIGPVVGITGVIIGGWSVAAGVFLGAIAVLFAFLFKALFASVGLMMQVSTFFFIVGCIGAGMLGILFMLKATEWFVKGLVAYLRWNLKFIRGRA